MYKPSSKSQLNAVNYEQSMVPGYCRWWMHTSLPTANREPGKLAESHREREREPTTTNSTQVQPFPIRRMHPSSCCPHKKKRTQKAKKKKSKLKKKWKKSNGGDSGSLILEGGVTRETEKILSSDTSDPGRRSSCS